jgi:hypothetical protein
MNAPKVWIIVWKNFKNDTAIMNFATKAEALAYVVDENLTGQTPIGQGIFVYRLGSVAAVKEFVGTWD